MTRKSLITLAIVSATLIAAASAQASERISVSFGFYAPAVEYVHYPAPVVYRASPVQVRYITPGYGFGYENRHHRHGFRGGYEPRRHWHHGHGRGHQRHHWD